MDLRTFKKPRLSMSNMKPEEMQPIVAVDDVVAVDDDVVAVDDDVVAVDDLVAVAERLSPNLEMQPIVAIDNTVAIEDTAAITEILVRSPILVIDDTDQNAAGDLNLELNKNTSSFRTDQSCINDEENEVSSILVEDEEIVAEEDIGFDITCLKELYKDQKINDSNNSSEDLDSLLDIMLDENRVRSSDLLIDDEEIVLINDRIEVLDHLDEIFIDADCEKTMEEDVSADNTPSAVGNQKLFPGSLHTLGVTILLMCCFMIRFRLPDEAFYYLLRIFATILPHGNSLFRSLYHLRKFTKQFTQDMLPTVYYYCSFCYASVNVKDKKCASCKKDMTKSGGMAYFVHLKIISQLCALWKNRDFTNDVRTHRFDHYHKNKTGHIKDVYDGIMYKRLYDNGELRDPNNLSFSLNTDGAPLFKSSRVSMWPVYMLINELPIAKRKRRQNSIFYGVWVSSKKPQMWSFLEPLYRELYQLETNGELFQDNSGNTFKSRCFLLSCTCDLPARAIVYNVNQFNGQYSCWFCLEKGKSHKLETGGICHIFPFDDENPKGTPRTRETVISDIELVQDNFRNGVINTTVNGHKGPFWFLYLKMFDPIYSCIIDYMHGVCLGITKLMLTLWFDAAHKYQEYSVYKARENVDKLLKDIKPTVYVTRIPRSLNELGHWKSSEFRTFLLYWGIPLMKNVLKQEYFIHFCLLVRSIYILSMESISPSDIVTAERALLLFVQNFSLLYGDRYLTLNLHQLVHLADSVRHTGPLFVNNCFIFEDLNGYIVKHIHGTQGVETQLVNIIGLLKAIPIMSEYFLEELEDDELNVLVDEMTDSLSVRRKIKNEIENGVTLVGQMKTSELMDEDAMAVAKYELQGNNVQVFLCINMFRKGFYVYGSSYNRLTKRQQHVITYKDTGGHQFGSVSKFIQGQTQDGAVNLAIVKPYRKLQQLGCIWNVKLTDMYIAIPLNVITNVNNFVIVGQELYICPPPNRYDRD